MTIHSAASHPDGIQRKGIVRLRRTMPLPLGVFALTGVSRITVGRATPQLAPGGATAYSSAMSKTFESVVEQARACSTEEKEELKFLLERAIIEERREEIQANHRRSQDELKRGGLKFSSSISQLKKSLAE